MDPSLLNDDSTGNQRQMLLLEHQLLPKLASNEFVEWDRDDNEIRRGRHYDALMSVAVALKENEGKLPEGWP
ncbi:hypothetical protein ACFQE1_07635 [Halobium palmae]|uniref:Uncharacterized protein n=1 Tax=Halobium palmae TaxID=1776492 RepID=A0ABD5RYA4_9EURY